MNKTQYASSIQSKDSVTATQQRKKLSRTLRMDSGTFIGENIWQRSFPCSPDRYVDCSFESARDRRCEWAPISLVMCRGRRRLAVTHLVTAVSRPRHDASSLLCHIVYEVSVRHHSSWLRCYTGGMSPSAVTTLPCKRYNGWQLRYASGRTFIISVYRISGRPSGR